MFELDNFSKHLPKVGIDRIAFLCKQASQSTATSPLTAFTPVQAYGEWHVRYLHVDPEALEELHHVRISDLEKN